MDNLFDFPHASSGLAAKNEPGSQNYMIDDTITDMYINRGEEPAVSVDR